MVKCPCSYLRRNVSPEPLNEVTAMAQHAALVVSTIGPCNDICAVSICPYHRVGDVGREQLKGPVETPSWLFLAFILLSTAEDSSEKGV